VNDEDGITWKVVLVQEKTPKLFGINGAEINVFFAAPPMYRCPPKHTCRKITKPTDINVLDFGSREDQP
jgi:hypothetical protein